MAKWNCFNSVELWMELDFGLLSDFIAVEWFIFGRRFHQQFRILTFLHFNQPALSLQLLLQFRNHFRIELPDLSTLCNEIIIHCFDKCDRFRSYIDLLIIKTYYYRRSIGWSPYFVRLFFIHDNYPPLRLIRCLFHDILCRLNCLNHIDTFFSIFSE